METHDEIKTLQDRLAVYRRSLAHELGKAAQFGGEQRIPVETMNSINEIRTYVQALKAALRAAGVVIADQFDDSSSTPHLFNTSPTPSTQPETLTRSEPSPVSDLPFASCFVSYSTEDEAFAQQLVNDLRTAGLQIWFAPDDMHRGGKMYEQIKAAISRQDRLLIVLSAASLASSWVETELRLARRIERSTKQRKLFPIRLVDMATLRQWECFDAEEGRDLAVEVREYFIPDFSNWQDSAAFERGKALLLRDLRAADATT